MKIFLISFLSIFLSLFVPLSNEQVNKKEEFMQILSDEGKNASGEIGLWIRNYIKSIKIENGGSKKWKLFLYLAVSAD